MSGRISLYSSLKGKSWMSVVVLVWSLVIIGVSSFTIGPSSKELMSKPKPYNLPKQNVWTKKDSTPTTKPRSSTELQLVPVPDGFFTFSGIIIGLSMSFSRAMTRVIIENRAWERRLEEARELKLDEDPTLTELDLRREEAANAPSIYGLRSNTQRKRRNSDTEEDDEYEYNMTEEEISAFEKEFGIAYDPYYDEPYEEDELPDDIPFTVDRTYGDRRYENGEIFYFDKETGLYYRQGGKPRLKQFWE